jgi:hypothetical protein
MGRLHLVCLLLSLGLAASCASPEEPPEDGDPLTGTWVGEFGPAFYDRNTITLDLNWDGKSLTGTVRPGNPAGRMYRNFESFPIENASFDPNTRVIKFEAVFQPRGRHYFIEGKVDRRTLSGTWNRPDEKKDGDFKLSRKPGKSGSD